MQELFVREMSEFVNGVGEKKIIGNCEIMDVLISLIVMIVSQCLLYISQSIMLNMLYRYNFCQSYLNKAGKIKSILLYIKRKKIFKGLKKKFQFRK